MISIVIPTLNESVDLANTLQSIFDAVSNPVEVIVVDGGSVDNTVEIATGFGVQVMVCKGGRSVQMNAGAAVATGDILIFLHGDTVVPMGFDRWIDIFDCTKSSEIPIAGAFNLKINSDRWLLRLVEWGVKVRSELFNLPYGDQALFLKVSTFRELGGFPELPIKIGRASCRERV